LLAELDDRIEWAFEVFEKKLKELDGTVELEGEEYRKRKEEITKEYKVELSKLIDGISGDGKETPLTEGASEKDGGKTGKDAGDGKSEDKAKERPKLIKNLKTFVIAGEKINKQANDLASRLKLTLDKFREAKEKAKEEGKEAVKSPEGGENKNFSVVATLESFFESPGEVPSATLQLLPNLATALRGVKTSPTDPSGPPPQSQQNLPKNSKNTENKISEI
ncbi:MAG: hypothetical protein LBU15_03075, partial [Rickettsiales bacterium]|nr:hypothetical protein [Rickettsiales bacterium]